ncbi:scamp family-domain-containing protein [Dichotomocladium elegans]|nr:scamp family-domain-containing protein [Dichotomocladium elegans]
MSHNQPSPFDDPSNPFQDPSITSALNSNRQESSYHLEQDTINQHQDDFTTMLVDDSRSPPTAGGSAMRGAAHNDDLSAREEALRQKERELAAREEQLLQGRQRPASNNFPPCFPIMYLDITTEIPLNHQSTVWWLYREWLWFELTLVLNFMACLCLLFSHPESVTSAPTDLGIALTEMFTHTLASFFLWYRPVYNAYMKDVSLYYSKSLFFIFNGFHCLYTFYKAIGIPNTGGAGLILVVTLFTDKYIITGIIALLAAVSWIGMGCLAVYMYLQTYRHYKAAGHTFKEAKDDAYGRIGRSSTARDAAIGMASWNARR